MSPNFRTLKDLAIHRSRQTEFDVESGDFSHLEVRGDGDFYYFYDSSTQRLIKNFLLRTGPQVDTLCGVHLIKRRDILTPRLVFWKRNKAKNPLEALTEDELVSGTHSILVKARVDVKDCHETVWKLIAFLQAYRGIELPSDEFRVMLQEDIDIAEALKGHDKAAVLSAVKTYLHGELTEADVQMLLDRRKTLDKFDRLLTDGDFFKAEMSRLKKKGEAVWQSFFEDNTWIFGYGLTLVACQAFSEDRLEQITSGSNVFSGGGKRIDALMMTRGFVQTLLLAEIKRHDTELLLPEPYRRPDVYQVSDELSGAVSQVQKTSYKAIRKLEALHRSHTPAGDFDFEVSTIRPKQIVVIGNLEELSDHRSGINIEKLTSFELYRRDHQEVEIITFDELYQRSKFIVDSAVDTA